METLLEAIAASAEGAIDPPKWAPWDEVKKRMAAQIPNLKRRKKIAKQARATSKILSAYREPHTFDITVLPLGASLPSRGNFEFFFRIPSNIEVFRQSLGQEALEKAKEQVYAIQISGATGDQAPAVNGDFVLDLEAGLHNHRPLFRKSSNSNFLLLMGPGGDWQVTSKADKEANVAGGFAMSIAPPDCLLPDNVMRWKVATLIKGVHQWQEQSEVKATPISEAGWREYEAKMSVAALVLQTKAIAIAKAEAPVIRIRGASGEHAKLVNGYYRLQEEAHNHRPLYRKTSHEDIWILCGPSGCWAVTGSETKTQNRAGGWCLSNSETLTQRHELYPALAKRWKVACNKRWVFQRTLKVEALSTREFSKYQDTQLLARLLACGVTVGNTADHVQVPVVSRPQIMELNSRVQALGLSRGQMTEAAARCVVRFAQVMAMRSATMDGGMQRRTLVILAGQYSDNGAIGLAAGRYFANRGLRVKICLDGRRDNLTPNATAQLQALLAAGATEMSLKELSGLRLKPGRDLVIDALLGCDVKGAPRKSTAALIRWAVNVPEGVTVWSLDMPSGLDMNSGAARDPCVRATSTLCFGLPTVGVCRAPENNVGGLFLCDVGMPLRCLQRPLTTAAALSPPYEDPFRFGTVVRFAFASSSGHDNALMLETVKQQQKTADAYNNVLKTDALKASLSKLMQETMSKLIGLDAAIAKQEANNEARPKEEAKPEAEADPDDEEPDSGALTAANANDVD